MKLSELIAAVGDENVGLQNLDQSADTLAWSAKKGLTKVTFHTEQALIPNGSGNGLPKLGIVVWLDREAVKKAMAKCPPPRRGIRWCEASHALIRQRRLYPLNPSLRKVTHAHGEEEEE